MIRACKTEIRPSDEQRRLLAQSFGNARWLYNRFLEAHEAAYRRDGSWLSGYDFSKALNNDPESPEWLRLSPSKSNKRAIMDAERAVRACVRNRTGRPAFKRYSERYESIYLVGTIHVERHRVFLPCLKWVRLKEFGYIPDGVRSVTVSREHDRYYVSAIVESEDDETANDGEPLGIDVGIKDLATLSDGTKYGNVNQTPRMRALSRSLRRQQRRLSRMLEANMESRTYWRSGPKTGQLRSYHWKRPLRECSNIRRQQLRIARIQRRINNARVDRENKVVADIIARRPGSITLEDLNVKGMLRNHHLARALAEQRISGFSTKLASKARSHGIEVRKVDRFYPSSKLCSDCGSRLGELRLSTREWVCPVCGSVHDRDVNAALNLRDASEYVVV